MARVLITEEIAPRGLERIAEAGHEVDVRLGLSPEELLEAMPGAAALVVRSATKVTPEVIAAGSDLRIVGRAGIGLDNVDVGAATAAGVLVANAPFSNAVSAAEHTMGLMLALARNIPQANEALVAGRWERSKWNGVELDGKTLGIIGLGRIGSLVATRAAAFGMTIIAYDPYLTADQAATVGATLVDLDFLISQSDFITLHLAKTPETMDLINASRLALAKPDLRIINVARGGIINEQALADAIAEGRIAGAALDVFDVEPKVNSPVAGLDGVVVTPHLGASTVEAQDKAGVDVAEMVVLALAGEPVPYAVNAPSSS
jgi:D-3-phosphoglycerate dehydrogenase